MYSGTQVLMSMHSCYGRVIRQVVFLAIFCDVSVRVATCPFQAIYCLRSYMTWVGIQGESELLTVLQLLGYNGARVFVLKLRICCTYVMCVKLLELLL